MTKKFEDQLKKTAQIALKEEFGFAPCLSEITLLECDGDRTYIRFHVHGNVYAFNSRIEHIGDMETVWCGKGTITRQEEI
jgi:hypothetical protein